MINPNENIIEVNSISKKFNIGYKDDKSVLSRLVNFLSGRENKKNFSAISNVSFEITKGEVMGLIGRNGSGKSTLLRLIAGIYVPDFGAVNSVGEIMYINGLNHGIRPRLTMKENIFLLGSIMSLHKTDVQKQFQGIIDFSGLGDFVNTKVYQFSSGMVTRLNFSIFIHFMSIKNPKIILIDEILGVGGDIDFNRKAELKIAEFIKSGITVILASHNLQDIKKYCKRVIWLEDGSIRADGDIDNILLEYKDKLSSKPVSL